MSACPDCKQAAEAEHWGFRSGCMGCCARAMARGPHFHRCQEAGVQDRQYRQALEHFGLTHQQVLEAKRADALKSRPRA